MALPINIEDLLRKQRVESNRIEFKEGWNPTSIYHSICAFANDIDNLGGGYVVVGVEEKDGVAVRPVKGVPEESLDKIQREIHQFNQLIEPLYAPRLSVEEVDGKFVVVIWVITGHNRPYSVPADVNAKLKKPVFYIRYGASSIEAKGEFLDQLRDMANRVPFDDRGNEDINIDDISPLLLKDYLSKIDSRLAKANFATDMEQILDQMQLFDGPKEKRLIKISILSYSGPDRSISMESLKEARILRSRRYRNRRLGDFLKELDLTEGRATGIPTIQKKLQENGSPKATIETDESRSYFLIDIPARLDFVQDANKIKGADIERVKTNMSKMCPRCVQDMPKNEIDCLAICLLRAQKEISAQEMLDGIDKVSYKQKKRKYLDKLLEIGAVSMTIPDKPTSKNQKYFLSDLGQDIIHKQ